MPRPNPHKLAAQSIRLSGALDSAIAGKFEIGLIERPLGRSQFLIRLDRSRTRIVSITSSVLRGGRTSQARAEKGHYLIVDGEEVQGVVNTQDQVKQLRKSGRTLPLSEEGYSAGALGDFFQLEAAEVEEGDIWGKRDEERIAQAAELELRIRRKRSGAAVAVAEDLLRGRTEEEAALEAEEAEEVEASAAAPKPRQASGPNRAERRAAEAAAAAAAAEEAARAEEVAAYYREAARREQEEEALLNRPVPARWDEEEIDIDAI